jgi:hypothetical protein
LAVHLHDHSLRPPEHVDHQPGNRRIAFREWQRRGFAQPEETFLEHAAGVRQPRLVAFERLA